MSKHAPEPWQFYTPCEYPNDFRIATYGAKTEPPYVGRLTSSHGTGSPNPNREDAARIVACVNALAGIPDPAAFVKAARELYRAGMAVEQEHEDAHLMIVRACMAMCKVDPKCDHMTIGSGETTAD